jgi:hypothetical protein
MQEALDASTMETAKLQREAAAQFASEFTSKDDRIASLEKLLASVRAGMWKLYVCIYYIYAIIIYFDNCYNNFIFIIYE